MKKLLVFVIFIIILVYINWLSDGMAQSIEDQARLHQQAGDLKQNRAITLTTSYQTPPIFEQGEVAGPDSGKNTSSPRAAQQSSDGDQSSQVVADQITRFGQNLFTSPQVAEINEAVVPDDYRLGPGDNLIISLWGRVQQEWNLTVDRQGQIFIPKVGQITAWGMTLDEFSQRLDAQLSAVYTGYERKITLGKIRTIKVFMYGEVYAPGGYAISALSTLFSALHRAGGPTTNGSLRQIKLIRNDKTVLIDLYDFLIKGDKSCDLALSSGDVVFVPLAGPQATIRGEVRRPGIYELVGGEEISDLIALAGGPTAGAYLDRLMLDRVGENDSREVVDLDFNGEDKQDLPVADGDELTVFSIYQMRENIVWVDGMVKHPGTYQRGDGMRIRDLIEKGQLLSTNVYMKRADVYRRLPDGRTQIIAVDMDQVLSDDSSGNILLADLDSLHVYSADQVEPQRYVYIDGVVQKPGRYPLYDNLTVADLIFLAGNLKESAYRLEGELARINSAGNTTVVQVPLVQQAPGQDLSLQENDHLFVRKIPGYELHRVVVLDGEVQFPGQYSLSQKNETLWQLLSRAGGFTEKAFPVGAIFKRAAIAADLHRKDIENVLERSRPLMADSTGVLRPAETSSISAWQMDRIVIDMERLMATKGAEGDFPLQTGDHIYIPEIPSGIPVLGEVCANGTIKYQPRKSVGYYLDQAGGFTKRADKGEIRLVKANGRVFSSGGVKGKKVDLGDVIVVPTEIKKERDWFKYLTTSLSVLTGVATSILIIDRL